MELTIAGQKFTISTPYAEGHVLTAVEAKVLNQTRAENVRNNTANKVKKALEEGTDPASIVADYDKEYVFTTGREGSAARKLDPLERVARRLAKELLREKLSEKGLKIGTPPQGRTEEEWAAFIESKIEEFSNHPDIVKMAKKELADKKKNAEGLDLGF